MVEYSGGEAQEQQGYSGPMPPQGMMPANYSGILRRFLESGETFDDQLIQAGLPMDDAESIAELFRLGVTFQLPELVLHASHVLLAATGANDKAKEYAIQGITGYRAQQRQPQRSGNVLGRFFKRQGGSKVNADSL